MDNTSSEHVIESMQSLSVPDPSVLSEAPPKSAPASSPQPNPWQDTSLQVQDAHPEGLHTPDPSTLDPSFHAPSPDPPLVASSVEAHPEILDEFDPLADQKEKESREAWGQTRGHPPLPIPEPIPVPSTPEPSEKKFKRGSWALNVGIPGRESPPPSASSSSSPFSSLASLARTFAIPSLPKQRPTSLDAARAVPSPTTISSFASQQNRQPRHTDPPASSQQPEESSEADDHTTTPNRVKSTEQAFDFQQFLDQMKTKGAEPVAKYLRSFLSNFAKRTFTIGDQVKIINDFLTFISGRMRECDVWRDASDIEFDNAMEGMEKLVMNRLYDFTFTPHVAQMVPPRPVTTDDLERDRVLAQRVALFSWIEEKHLDIPVGEGSSGFMMFAQQELLKINHYKAPRDKLICILNCCKVIFGLIRHLKSDEGADSFVPILIFVVLKANPPHLLSNVEFINRFRNPEKLQSEAGYYLSSLMGAVSFIETMDSSSLSNITQEEFEKNVEAAIQSLPAPGSASPNVMTPASSAPSTPRRSTHSLPVLSPGSSHSGEESARPLSISTPTGPSENARRFLQKTGDTISKPLNAIGRIFSEVLDGVADVADGGLGDRDRDGDGKPTTYLPGPFAPFELGRERRREQQQRDGGGPPAQYWTHPDHARRPSYLSEVQTPISGGGGGGGGGAPPPPPPPPMPYKPRVRRSPTPGSISAFPSGASAAGMLPWQEATSSRQGLSPPLPATNNPLSMGPSRALAPARVQSLAYPETPVRSPSPFAMPSLLSPSPSSHLLGAAPGTGAGVSRTATPNLDFAGMQAEIDRAHSSVANAAKNTLRQIFPNTDPEVMDWVLEANEGDLGKSIEALLEMSSGS